MKKIEGKVYSWELVLASSNKTRAQLISEMKIFQIAESTDRGKTKTTRRIEKLAKDKKLQTSLQNWLRP